MINPVGAFHHAVEEILGLDVVYRAGVGHLPQNGEEGGLQRVIDQDIWSIEVGPDNHCWSRTVSHFLLFLLF